MLTIIVIVASFIGVAALVGGVAVFFRGDASREVEDRLDVFAGSKAASGKGKAADSEPSLLSSACPPLRNGRASPDFDVIRSWQLPDRQQ